MGRPGFNPWVGKIPWRRERLLKFSGLENSTGCIVGVAELDITEQLLEKAMAPHSRTPAWKIPLTEEPGRLQSVGSLRVGHD